jgi:UDP-2,3-diacylglucosamine pyrophosphatase LpxH
MNKKYHTIWISDVHLGTLECKASSLIDFLKQNHTDTLYLVGDIIDCWQLKKAFYWPQTHNDVIQHLLMLSRNGTKVIYVVGNHDSFLRDYLQVSFDLGGITFCEETEYVSLSNKRFLILHGDLFDEVTKHPQWIICLGDWAYTLLLLLNTVFNKIRRLLGLHYWSLSTAIKKMAKNATTFIHEFESALVHECRKRNFDGVVCGHIHHAELKNLDEVLYCNVGDWVESCTALVEHYDGNLEIIKWANH